MSLRKTLSKRKKSVSFRSQTCSVGWESLGVLRLSPKHAGTRKHQCLFSTDEIRLSEDRPRTDTCVYMYEVCPESILPCTMKNRDIYWRRCKIQETLYMAHWCLSTFQSRHLRASVFPASLPLFNTLQNPLLESPSAAPLYFPESHQWFEISSLSKVNLVFQRARSCQIRFIGSGLNQVISNCSTMFLLPW